MTRVHFFIGVYFHYTTSILATYKITYKLSFGLFIAADHRPAFAALLLYLRHHQVFVTVLETFAHRVVALLARQLVLVKRQHRLQLRLSPLIHLYILIVFLEIFIVVLLSLLPSLLRSLLLFLGLVHRPPCQVEGYFLRRHLFS